MEVATDAEVATGTEVAIDAVMYGFTGQMVTAAEAKERREYLEQMGEEEEYMFSYGDAASPQVKQHLQRNRTRKKKKKR